MQSTIRRIRSLTGFFIFALVLSGVTAIPLIPELELLIHFLGPENTSPLAQWLQTVHQALVQTNRDYPFLAYGTDWLAFGHFVIAIAYVGAWRDPVKNVWLYDFGMIACVLVLPYALLFGAIRGIPFYWRLVDCAFGVLGFIPLCYCKKLIREIEAPIVLAN